MIPLPDLVLTQLHEHPPTLVRWLFDTINLCGVRAFDMLVHHQVFILISLLIIFITSHFLHSGMVRLMSAFFRWITPTPLHFAVLIDWLSPPKTFNHHLGKDKDKDVVVSAANARSHFNLKSYRLDAVAAQKDNTHGMAAARRIAAVNCFAAQAKRFGLKQHDEGLSRRHCKEQLPGSRACMGVKDACTFTTDQYKNDPIEARTFITHVDTLTCERSLEDINKVLSGPHIHAAYTWNPGETAGNSDELAFRYDENGNFITSGVGFGDYTDRLLNLENDNAVTFTTEWGQTLLGLLFFWLSIAMLVARVSAQYWHNSGMFDMVFSYGRLNAYVFNFPTPDLGYFQGVSINDDALTYLPVAYGMPDTWLNMLIGFPYPCVKWYTGTVQYPWATEPKTIILQDYLVFIIMQLFAILASRKVVAYCHKVYRLDVGEGRCLVYFVPNAKFTGYAALLRPFLWDGALKFRTPEVFVNDAGIKFLGERRKDPCGYSIAYLDSYNSYFVPDWTTDTVYAQTTAKNPPSTSNTRMATKAAGDEIERIACALAIALSQSRRQAPDFFTRWGLRAPAQAVDGYSFQPVPVIVRQTEADAADNVAVKVPNAHCFMPEIVANGAYIHAATEGNMADLVERRMKRPKAKVWEEINERRKTQITPQLARYIEEFAELALADSKSYHSSGKSASKPLRPEKSPSVPFTACMQHTSYDGNGNPPVDDGDTIVSWPDSKTFWVDKNYRPFKSKGHMEQDHHVTLCKWLRTNPTHFVFFNPGPDFFLKFSKQIAGVIQISPAELQRNLEARAKEQKIHGGANSLSYQNTMKDQDAYIALAIEKEVALYSSFESAVASGRPGLYIAASGAGKTRFVETTSSANETAAKGTATSVPFNPLRQGFIDPEDEQEFYDSRTKRQKFNFDSVRHVYDIITIDNLLAGTQLLDGFKKSEFFQNPTKPARGITQFDPKAQAIGGRLTHAYAKALSGCKWLGCGLTPAEITERVVAVCTGHEKITVNDFTAQDATIDDAKRIIELVLLMYFFRPEYHALLLEWHYSDYCGAVRYGRTIEDLDGARGSGSPFTTMGNSPLTACFAYIALRMDGHDPSTAYNKLGVYSGDDGITASVSDESILASGKMMGFIVKSDVVTDHVPFLGRIYLNPCDGDPISACDPLRALAKLHTTLLPTDAFNAEEVALLKAICYQATDKHTDFFGPWSAKLLRDADQRKLNELQTKVIAYPNLHPYFAITALRTECTFTTQAGAFIDYFDEQMPDFDWGKFDDWLESGVGPCPTLWTVPPVPDEALEAAGPLYLAMKGVDDEANCLSFDGVGPPPKSTAKSLVDKRKSQRMNQDGTLRLRGLLCCGGKIADREWNRHLPSSGDTQRSDSPNSRTSSKKDNVQKDLVRQLKAAGLLDEYRSVRVLDEDHEDYTPEDARERYHARQEIVSRLPPSQD